MDESDFVTDLAAQAFEIMGSLPELQPTLDDHGEPREDGVEGPSRRAAGGGAPQDEESCESARPSSCVVTGFAAQTLEIMGSLPELQPAQDGGGGPRETGAASAPSASLPGASEAPEAAAAPLQTEPDPTARVRWDDAASPVSLPLPNPNGFRRVNIRMIPNGVMAG
jgi:hypothetical protein